jgi:hypothetical protein
MAEDALPGDETTGGNKIKKGAWSGTAMKAGKKHMITVDYKGDVTVR